MDQRSAQFANGRKTTEKKGEPEIRSAITEKKKKACGSHLGKNERGEKRKE